MSRWLRMADLEPEPPEPVVPVHLPRDEDPLARRSRRLAALVSAIVHLTLILLVLLAPGLMPEALRRMAGGKPAILPKIPVVFQEFRQAPPPRPAERRPESRPGNLVLPPAPAPAQDGDSREAVANRVPLGPDQGQRPPSGGSVLPSEAGPAARPAPSSRPGTRPFDLNRALEDFRRQVPPRDSGETEQEPRPRGDSGFHGGGLQFESQDFDWRPFYNKYSLELLRVWCDRVGRTASSFERFAFERGSPELIFDVLLAFSVQRNGEVTNIRVESPSGCPPLDQSAVHALQEADLPALPSGFPRETENARMLFSMNIDIQSLKNRAFSCNYY